MDTTLDPLRNSELHRALAFARARETYPGLPGELLLELCDAAWSRAAGDTRDGGALERFERALDVVARSYRVGGGRLTVSEVAEDAIPLAALQPYIDAQKRRPAPVEPHPEPVAAPPRRTLADKLCARPADRAGAPRHLARRRRVRRHRRRPGRRARPDAAGAALLHRPRRGPPRRSDRPRPRPTSGPTTAAPRAPPARHPHRPATRPARRGSASWRPARRPRAATPPRPRQ